MTYAYEPPLHEPPRRRPRPGTVFAVVNGATLAVHLLLAQSAEAFLATRVWGETTVGLLGLLLQGALLVVTAVRYDRHADHARTDRHEPEPPAAAAEQPGRWRE